MPNLAVILTGSLLDQVLNDCKLPSPVGRIEPYLKKQADRAVRISSAKPSLASLEAKSNGQIHSFQLFNILFYLVNRLEQLLAS